MSVGAITSMYRCVFGPLCGNLPFQLFSAICPPCVRMRVQLRRVDALSMTHVVLSVAVFIGRGKHASRSCDSCCAIHRSVMVMFLPLFFAHSAEVVDWVLPFSLKGHHHQWLRPWKGVFPIPFLVAGHLGVVLPLLCAVQVKPIAGGKSLERNYRTTTL
jgi:hypothetical protein